MSTVIILYFCLVEFVYTSNNMRRAERIFLEGGIWENWADFVQEFYFLLNLIILAVNLLKNYMNLYT
jgi:hypothetical protein